MSFDNEKSDDAKRALAVEAWLAAEKAKSAVEQERHRAAQSGKIVSLKTEKVNRDVLHLSSLPKQTDGAAATTETGKPQITLTEATLGDAAVLAMAALAAENVRCTSAAAC